MGYYTQIIHREITLRTNGTCCIKIFICTCCRKRKEPAGNRLIAPDWAYTVVLLLLSHHQEVLLTWVSFFMCSRAHIWGFLLPLLGLREMIMETNCSVRHFCCGRLSVSRAGSPQSSQDVLGLHGTHMRLQSSNEMHPYKDPKQWGAPISLSVVFCPLKDDGKKQGGLSAMMLPHYSPVQESRRWAGGLSSSTGRIAERIPSWRQHKAHFFAHTGHDHSITLDFFDVTSLSGSPEWPWELFSVPWVLTRVNINLLQPDWAANCPHFLYSPFAPSHFPFDTASCHLSPAFSSCFAASLFQNSHSSPLLLPLPPSLLQFLRPPELLEKSVLT